MPMSNWPGIYNTGTATVPANGQTVTFQSAGNLAEAVRAGDMFGSHVSAPVRIERIGPGDGLNANQVRLAYPWRGPAQSAAPYEIQFSPYDSGYRQAMMELLERFGGGAVAALSEISLANDRGIFANGPNSLDTFPMSPAARALLGDATVPRLGTGGSQVRTNTQNDGRFLQPGAFGLGGEQPPVTYQSQPASAIDEITQTSWARVAANFAGLPPGATGSGMLLTEAYLPTIRIQTFKQIDGSRVIRRAFNNSAWTPWRIDYEYGENASGSYERFGNGVQFCWIRNKPTFLDGSVWRAANENYPASFAGPQIASIVTPSSDPTFYNGSNNDRGRVVYANRPTSGGGGYILIGYPTNPAPTGTTGAVDIFAAGRWYP